MAKKLISRAVNALTRCPACKGSGKVAHYRQGCNEVIQNGRTVAETDCTVMKTCDTCGGTGR
ncbi:hypothetical protein [Micromonospora mirobrigensis]|uniref:Uncharacterized protein n=1 Tax=Micromonospora mirobrigensis TaxID=262898 RepID=A0A1C4ZLX9_9ACTN|nr:hypothetical protein [Micromonospora mirobrigensis]SCF33935.1 hypothetical protein GA0070564_10643 [Micromonospora mirobrigensis]